MCNDDTEKVPIQRRREDFAALDVWKAVDQRYTSGVYVGVVTTPKKFKSNVEGEVLLPSMCGRFLTTDVRLGYALELDDTKKVPI